MTKNSPSSLSKARTTRSYNRISEAFDGSITQKRDVKSHSRSSPKRPSSPVPSTPNLNPLSHSTNAPHSSPSVSHGTTISIKDGSLVSQTPVATYGSPIPFDQSQPYTGSVPEEVKSPQEQENKEKIHENFGGWL